MVDEGFEHKELGIQGFGFNLFDEDREGCVRGYVKEFPYLLMIIKLWPGGWEEQLDHMNTKVDKYNGRGGINIMDNFGSFGGFQGMDSVRTLGFLFKHQPLALWGTDCRGTIII